MVLILLDHAAVLVLKAAVRDMKFLSLKHCLKEILQLLNLFMEPMPVAVIYNLHQ
jgi:hypothetical protein